MLYINLLANIRVINCQSSSPYYQACLLAIGRGNFLVCLNFYNNIPSSDRKAVMVSLESDLEGICTGYDIDPLVIWCRDFNIHLCHVNSANACGVIVDI